MGSCRKEHWRLPRLSGPQGTGFALNRHWLPTSHDKAEALIIDSLIETQLFEASDETSSVLICQLADSFAVLSVS